jgi:hypothetical protein
VRATDSGHFKDQILDRLARHHNVAQFASFAPGETLELRHWRLHGGAQPEDAASAVKLLLERSAEGSVNIRSFDPLEPKSRDFVYGLTAAGDVLSRLSQLAGSGLFTIVNETVDVHDGGVSGVVLGGVCEFSPDDTPRAVEKGGTVAMAARDADRLLEIVYGFNPGLASFPRHTRIEFSVHPLRRGLRREHTIVWEAEEVDDVEVRLQTEWPNNFSRLVGDKTFGLLMADLIGLPVPRTTVITRRVAPFSFGSSTGTGDTWIRTAPREPVPGYFTTKKGWIDPVALWEAEDPDGTVISSVLAQDGVDSLFSGALLADEAGSVTVEGVHGEGDAFMVGEAAPVDLPDAVLAGVRRLFDAASARFGPVRMEWAFDGNAFWVLQMHRGTTGSNGRVVFRGEAERFRRFDVSEGISALRDLANEVEGTGEGIVLVGSVGVTSHFGDILRRARIPSRIEPG